MAREKKKPGVVVWYCLRKSALAGNEECVAVFTDGTDWVSAGRELDAKENGYAKEVANG